MARGGGMAAVLQNEVLPFGVSRMHEVPMVLYAL